MSDAEIATRSLLHAHARTVAELADRQALTLESILAILRSPRLDDRSARTAAIDAAGAALIDVRTRVGEQRESMLEPVVGAFARLTQELQHVARYGDLDVQFVEPPERGRALPSDVADAARAIGRIAVLAFIDEGAARRVRIQWDCDGRNLLIGIRDDGNGGLHEHDDALRPISERVTELDGLLSVDSLTGWGTNLAITIPLYPPQPALLDEQVELTARERDVLRLIVAGRRNAEISAELGISPNTVKFHVARLLRKTGSRNRAELISVVRRSPNG